MSYYKDSKVISKCNYAAYCCKVIMQIWTWEIREGKRCLKMEQAIVLYDQNLWVSFACLESQPRGSGHTK